MEPDDEIPETFEMPPAPTVRVRGHRVTRPEDVEFGVSTGLYAEVRGIVDSLGDLLDGAVLVSRNSPDRHSVEILLPDPESVRALHALLFRLRGEPAGQSRKESR